MSKFFHLGTNKIRCRDVSAVCNPQQVAGNPVRWVIAVLMHCGSWFSAHYPDEPTALAVHQKLIEACEESE